MKLRFSRMAEADLTGIAAYTLEHWGESQASRYLFQLESCCQQLALQPTLGRSCGSIRPGLYRIECGSHVIFFRRVEGGIFVSRVLHGRMLPSRHKMDEEG